MEASQQLGETSAPLRKPSGSVIALGIFNIGYAVLFRLCCGLGSVLALVFATAFSPFLSSLPEMEGAQMPPFDLMLSGPMRAYWLIKGFVLLTLGILLLCGGIGLLKLKPWGRTLSLGVAAAEIVWVLIDFAINVFFVYPATTQMMGEEFSQMPHMVGNVVFGVFFAFTKLVYPVVLLVCLNLSAIKDQFESAQGHQW